MVARLSPRDGRKLAILAQRALNPNRKGRAIDATCEVIEHLGYVQIDTISVIERAHHHTLWNRNPRYRQRQLDQLQRQGRVFEYWSHAAAYLPIRDYRMCLPNMEKIRSGDALWFRADPKIKNKVLERIRAEGPLQSRDFENHGATNLPMWEWKPAKYALETLFMEGKLMVAYRDKFQKVYDLRERVLPDDTDTSMPSRDEFLDYLIFSYLNAHGLGTASEMAYLRKGYKKSVESRLLSLEEEGRIQAVEVGRQNYWVQSGSLELLDQPLARSRLRILSPFDNLVIQRNRIRNLFGYDYQIECYVPEKKRKWGYFCLPILWNGDLVARMDCKADRKRGALEIRRFMVDPKLRRQDAFFDALKKSLPDFMRMNGCENLDLEQLVDSGFGSQLAACEI